MSSYYALIAVYSHIHQGKAKEITAIRGVSLDLQTIKEMCRELAQSDSGNIVRAFVTWHELDNIESMIEDEDISIYTCDSNGNATGAVEDDCS